MAVHTGLLRLETAGDGAIVDLTEGVRSIVERSGVQSGVAAVFAVGATVGDHDDRVRARRASPTSRRCSTA